MELENLKSSWQKAGTSVMTEDELKKMIRVRRHPAVKKIKGKLIIETIGLVFFLFVYYDWFDGDKKSFIVNVFLVSGLSLYILNDVIGYISLSGTVRGLNLKSFLQNYLARIKRLFVFSLLISLLYATALLVFFASVINFTKEKKLIFAGIIIVLIQMTLWSIRIWKRRIKHLVQQVEDFNGDGGN